MNGTVSEDQMLNTNEVAQMTGLSPATLATWRCRQSAALPYTKFSRRAVRYRLGDVREFMSLKVVNPQVQV